MLSALWRKVQRDKAVSLVDERATDSQVGTSAVDASFARPDRRLNRLFREAPTRWAGN